MILLLTVPDCQFLLFFLFWTIRVSYNLLSKTLQLYVFATALHYFNKILQRVFNICEESRGPNKIKIFWLQHSIRSRLKGSGSYHLIDRIQQWEVGGGSIVSKTIPLNNTTSKNNLIISFILFIDESLTRIRFALAVFSNFFVFYG